MEDGSFSVEVTLRDGYEMSVEFGVPGVRSLTVDEPPPLGEEAGPNPARLLGAAVGSCMSASLLFCLRRARVEVDGLRASVEGTIVRNERGRMRIGELRVKLQPSVDADDPRMARCMELFEDFCIVGQSVRAGIPLTVEVEPAQGEVELPAGALA
jgi:uncharacterized OsmC-like protein